MSKKDYEPVELFGELCNSKETRATATLPLHTRHSQLCDFDLVRFLLGNKALEGVMFDLVKSDCAL